MHHSSQFEKKKARMRQISLGMVPRPDSAHMCPLWLGAVGEVEATSLGAESGVSQELHCIPAHALLPEGQVS